jgi:thioredoxin reductase (NADPH)
MDVRDVVVVGAGPAGLATGIAASRAGLSYVLLEKGVLVNTVFHYPTNMVFFTTPELLEIGGLPFVTPHFKPTRVEALNYYRRVVDTYRLDVRLGEEVSRIGEDVDPTGARVLAVETRSAHGVRRLQHGRTVVLATGAFDKPNLVGVPGEDLPHVSHYYTEAHPHYRTRVVIVGGQNSAAEAALELYRAGVDVTLVHRDAALGDTIKYWVRPDIENRIKEGSVRARFETRVVEIRPTSVIVEHHGTIEELPADSVLLLTGYCSDTGLFERAGVAYDAATFAPRFDPETLESNVTGLFVVGAAITGRNSGKIFIENGRMHGEQVIATIARRLCRD